MWGWWWWWGGAGVPFVHTTCDYVPVRPGPPLWMQWQSETVLLHSLFESSYPPCDHTRTRPDEQALQRTRPGSDDSLRTRPTADDDRRTRPPECGNES